jgi:hypothetical protein
MKRAVLGALLSVGLVMAAVAAAEQRGETPGQRAMPMAPAPAVAAGTELIVVPTPLADKGQMLTVVDPRQRVISVYHIDLAGKITLKGVRNIQYDLQMLYLNNDNPLPQEIRSLLEQR